MAERVLLMIERPLGVLLAVRPKEAELASHLSLYDALYQCLKIDAFASADGARRFFLLRLHNRDGEEPADPDRKVLQQKARSINIDATAAVLLGKYNYIVGPTDELKLAAEFLNLEILLMTRSQTPLKYIKNVARIPELTSIGDVTAPKHIYLNVVMSQHERALYYAVQFFDKGIEVAPQLTSDEIAMWQAITLPVWFVTSVKGVRRRSSCMADALGLGSDNELRKTERAYGTTATVARWLEAAAMQMERYIVVHQATTAVSYGDIKQPSLHLLRESDTVWYGLHLDLTGWRLSDVRERAQRLNKFAVQHIQSHIEFLLSDLPPYQPWFVLVPYYAAIFRIAQFNPRALKVKCVDHVLDFLPSTFNDTTTLFLAALACLKDKAVWSLVEAEVNRSKGKLQGNQTIVNILQGAAVYAYIYESIIEGGRLRPHHSDSQEKFGEEAAEMTHFFINLLNAYERVVFLETNLTTLTSNMAKHARGTGAGMFQPDELGTENVISDKSGTGISPSASPGLPSDESETDTPDFTAISPPPTNTLKRSATAMQPSKQPGGSRALASSAEWRPTRVGAPSGHAVRVPWWENVSPTQRSRLGLGSPAIVTPNPEETRPNKDVSTLEHSSSTSSIDIAL